MTGTAERAPSRPNRARRADIVLARVRMPFVWAALVLYILSAFRVIALNPLWALLPLLAAFALYLRIGTPRRAAVGVSVPVRGRWLVFHSPADRIPSHGLHAYGQTFAMDLVCDPPEPERPRTGLWPIARRPRDFPGFGAPVLAAANGIVTRTHGWERDHWSRTSPVALIYLIGEMALREMSGPSRILGNHVIVDVGDGVYAVYAHLQRGSIRVAKGDEVVTGRQIAACGNSGNSTEPHVHFQLQDHPSVLLAAGVPFRFGGTLPHNGEHIVAT